MSRIARRIVVALALAALVAPLPAIAWGPEGHQIVGRIAEIHLTPAAASACKTILSGARISDSEVANWADDIRHSRSETAPWHFVDIPFDAMGYDAERDCRAHNGCVVNAVRDNARLAGDREASAKERFEALKFLVHFVGDMHQPLHCAERGGDRGGNLCYVHWPGESKVVKLHVVWDVYLVRKDLHDHGVDAMAYADKLDAAQTADLIKTWQRGTVADWAWETHWVAINDVYESVPAGDSAPMLSATYIERGQKDIQQQFMRAGVRLAKILNDLFTPTAGGKTP